MVKSFRRKRRIAPALWALVLAGLVGGQAAAQTDDPTFRELPLQKTPSPQDLMRRLTGLPLPPFPLRGPGPHDGAPGEESDPFAPGFSPTLPPNAPPWAKETLEDVRRSAQAFQESVQAESQPGAGDSVEGDPSGDRSRENAAPPSRRSEGAPHRRTVAESPGNNLSGAKPPDVGPRIPPNRPGSRGPATNPGSRWRLPGMNSENRAAESPTNRTPTTNRETPAGPQAENLAQHAPSRRGNSPILPRGQSYSPNSPDRAERSLPPPSSQSRKANPPRTPDREASQSRPALKSRKEFNDKMNRILLEAARRAANQEPSETSLAVANSRDSLLNPVLERVEKLLEDRTLRRKSRSWFNRHVRRGPARDWARRLDRSLDFPDGAGAEMSGVGVSSLVAAPVLLVVLAALLAPVVNRLRPKLAAYLQAAALAPFRVLRLESNEELVRAVDQFLVRRFGHASSWWHCRAVERALADLAPHLSDEIARLAAAYERARYGPVSHLLSAEQLEQSAGTLRKLAECLLAQEAAPQPVPSA